MDSEQLEKLIHELQNGTPHQRAKAALELGQSEMPEAVPSLIQAYEDKDATVRRNVVKGLKAIGSEEALEFRNTLPATEMHKEKSSWKWWTKYILLLCYLLTS